ncbi:hypothetical protein F5J12DRAFT_819398 [Pisolithus orientalis]|uniref:uncharacterized protein n=1 Tax=Pisolithus orientalis TaxID=936130 RepID=UPI002225AA26|nr:uncharacterized protein F5J12DRAFT_819398 [Pisolithus orientalis]KAI6012640.1 hypothetical protein F5J12DRAFT_819398 [Pisolithus orientalis]
MAWTMLFASSLPPWTDGCVTSQTLVYAKLYHISNTCMSLTTYEVGQTRNEVLLLSTDTSWVPQYLVWVITNRCSFPIETQY